MKMCRVENESEIGRKPLSNPESSKDCVKKYKVDY